MELQKQVEPRSLKIAADRWEWQSVQSTKPNFIPHDQQKKCYYSFLNGTKTKQKNTKKRLIIL